MARHCFVEIAVVIAQGTCRAASLRTFAGGCCPSTRTPISRTPPSIRPLNCRSRKGSAQQHVCSATGPGRRQILGTARHPVCYLPNRLLRHALIEVASPGVPQSTHSLRQTWLARIRGRPVLAIAGPMRKNRGRWRLGATAAGARRRRRESHRIPTKLSSSPTGCRTGSSSSHQASRSGRRPSHPDCPGHGAPHREFDRRAC